MNEHAPHVRKEKKTTSNWIWHLCAPFLGSSRRTMARPFLFSNRGNDFVMDTSPLNVNRANMRSYKGTFGSFGCLKVLAEEQVKIIWTKLTKLLCSMFMCEGMMDWNMEVLGVDRRETRSESHEWKLNRSERNSAVSSSIVFGHSWRSPALTTLDGKIYYFI